MTRFLIPALAIFVFVACDKKSKVPQPPAQKPAEQPAPVKKSTAAPKGVPQALKDLVDAKWPEIQKLGDAFVAEFAKATTAKTAGDRGLMDKSVEAASASWTKAADMWSEIVYWAQDMDDATQDACAKFLRPWEKKVHDWQSKAKGLAQFQRVK